MRLTERKELEELRAAHKDTAKERLEELEEELGLDDKEAKLYLIESWTEEAIEAMSWQKKLAWIITGFQTELADVDIQMKMNSLKGTVAETEVKELREKKIEREKRRLAKEEESIKAQEANGLLSPGSLENYREMRDRSKEYEIKSTSLVEDTKFASLSKDQLNQKKVYLNYRAKERSEELEELRDVAKARQEENAKKVLERIGPREYPTGK